MVDHCSFSWATDEVLQTGGAHDFTIQWSIVAEGLGNATHPEGFHSKGMHFRDENSVNISAHHNLPAHNYDRNPNVNSTDVVDLVNNLFYNATRWTEIKDSFGEPHVNIVNNYYKLGPSSGSSGYEVFYYNSTGRQPRVFVQGNIGFHRPTNDLSEDLIVSDDSRWMIVNIPFSAPPVTTVSAPEAFNLVLDNTGATLPVRDAHDARVVNDVRNGTGRIIDDPSEVGSWLLIAPAMPPDDMDHDGMPDAWENAHGFNKADPADGPQDADTDGYTNVEEYLNGTDPGLAGGGSGNMAPVLAAIGNKTTDEETALGFTATATDADSNLTFSLVGAIPAGAGIDDTTGIFSWTPTEVQGPGDYTFAVKVCNSAALCDTETISVHVNEVDQAPVLAAIGNKTTDEGTALNFTAAATDADRPANTLIFSLEGAPAGASTGIFSWTPIEAQGPGDYSFSVKVCDNAALCDAKPITVHVNEADQAPAVTITAPADGSSFTAGTAITFTGTVTDEDINLAASLSWTSDGQLIGTGGSFTTSALSAGSHTITASVTDSGGHPGSATITVTINPHHLRYLRFHPE